MAQEHNTVLIQVANNFLKSLEVPFTKSFFSKQLEANSYFPSIYSISEEFNYLNISNRCLKIKSTQLGEIPIPFLAYIKMKGTGGKDFVNVIKITDDSITYYDGKERIISKDEFISGWSNIVFLAQTNDNSGEKDFLNNKKLERKENITNYLLSAGFAAILLFAIYKFVLTSGALLAPSLSITFTILGLAVSVLLLIYEIDKSNTFVKNICTGGVKTNCNAVLGSKAAKIFNVSWSELGFFYFSFLFLFLLIPGTIFEEKKSVFTYLSFLTASYIPYSIYYQYRIAKQWCRMCLFVQAILFLNFVWALLYGDFILKINLQTVSLIIGCSIFPVLLWYTLKPVILKANDASKFSSAYKRLFSTPGVLNLTLAEQPDAPDGWQQFGIVKGNPNAQNIILKVCSPSCGHCDKAHKTFNEIIENNNDVKIVTVYDIWEEGNNRRDPVRHFLALTELGDGKQIEEAMNYWYLNENRNYETLKEMYPLPQDLLEKQDEIITQMAEWCKTAEIEYTPTVYVNGKQLSSTFKLEDLKDVL